MRKKIAMVAAGVIVTLASCKKNSNENVSVPNIQSAVQLSLKVEASDPASNPENPYDFIGYYHIFSEALFTNPSKSFNS